MPKEDGIELRWLFTVIRRWLWLIVVCALLGAIGAFVFTSLAPPVYSASATLLVQPASGSGMSDYQAILISERLASTYSKMLTQGPVMEAVIEQLQLPESAASLAGMVRVDPIENTQLIRLTVEHTSPAVAALVANALAEAFIEQIEALQSERYAESLDTLEGQIAELSAQLEATQARIDNLGTPQTTEEQSELAHLETILAGYRNTYATLLQNYEQMRLSATQSAQTVIIAEPARVPGSPIQRRMLYTVLASTIGAMAGVGLAFLLEHLDDSIKTPGDVSRTLGLKTIGTIGRLARRERNLIVATHPRSPHSEAFRVLSTNLRFSDANGPLRTLLVTSPGGGEGKSITSANLAVAMALAGLRVVVVDADLRRPGLDRFFDLSPRHEGLTEALLQGSLDGRLQPTGVEGLAILTSGEAPFNPAELLGSQRMQELVNDLARRADVILIDSPPVLPVADAALLARQVDGVLLVLHSGRTRAKAAQQAIMNLDQVGASMAGVVLNGVSPRTGGYYYTSYKYEDSKKESDRLPKLAPRDEGDGREPERTGEDEIPPSPRAPRPLPLRSRLTALASGSKDGVARPAADTPVAALAMLEAGERAGKAAGLGQEVEPLWASYEDFAQRDLSSFEVEYLFLDAVSMSPGDRGRSKGEVLCAWAICADGQKCLIHVAPGKSQVHQHWLGFLEDMVKRGLQAPLLVITDGTESLMRAVEEIFPTSLRQRCLVRKTHDVIAKVVVGARSEARATVRAAYQAPNRQVADIIAASVVSTYQARYPFAVKAFQEDWEACVAYMSFPAVHRRRIRSVTLLERTVAEERRRRGVRPRIFSGQSDLESTFETLWQASLRWQGVRMTPIERQQLELLRRELESLDGQHDAIQIQVPPGNA